MRSAVSTKHLNAFFARQIEIRLNAAAGKALSGIAVDSTLLALRVAAAGELVDDAHVVLLQLGLVHATAERRSSAIFRVVADSAHVLRRRITRRGIGTSVAAVLHDHFGNMDVVSGNLIRLPTCIDHGLNDLNGLNSEVAAVVAEGACRQSSRHHGLLVATALRVDLSCASDDVGITSLLIGESCLRHFQHDVDAGRQRRRSRLSCLRYLLIDLTDTDVAAAMQDVYSSSRLDYLRSAVAAGFSDTSDLDIGATTGITLHGHADVVTLHVGLLVAILHIDDVACFLLQARKSIERHHRRSGIVAGLNQQIHLRMNGGSFARSGIGDDLSLFA